MQQNSATLTYEWNPVKGTVERYFKKMAQAFKQYSCMPKKLDSSLKKTENCHEPP